MIAAARSRDYYQRWIALAEPGAKAEFFCNGRGAVSGRDVVAILVGDSDPDAAKRTRASLVAAFGKEISVCTAIGDIPHSRHIDPADASALETLLAAHRADARRWLLPIAAGDEVSPDLARAIGCAGSPADDCAVIYWDEDRRGSEGREAPWIKPDWDELLFSARDGLVGTSLLAIDRLLLVVGAQSPVSLDLTGLAHAALRLAHQPGASPLHVPLILTHRQAHCAASGFASVIPAAPAEWPSVSIIIPTRDQPALLRDCMAGLKRLDYGGEVEIIVVDNGTRDSDALDVLAGLERERAAKVLRQPGPFNFAALNNEAVGVAQGRFVCLLNNDVQALDDAWLGALVRHAVRDDAGAVGALLLYPDGTVQHAGVVIGIGGAAGHVQKGAALTETLFDSWFKVTRTVSAVTGACLVVEKRKYEAVGGMDEAAFPIAFNDLDLCLKLERAGWRNIFVAEARLLHLESKSRGSDRKPASRERFQAELAALRDRWGTLHCCDPYFSPLFSLSTERCTLTFQP